MHHGLDVILSEAWQLDCARWNINGAQTHAGCNGGNMPRVMQHIIDKDAVIPDETVAHDYSPWDKSVPYSECKEPYEYTKGIKLVKYSDWEYVHSAYDEYDMKALMVQRGPLVVAMDGNKIQDYVSGVISGVKCENYQLNHAVTLTAYDQDKYSLKNSWGRSWGDGGYFYLVPGTECLGIGTWCDSCITEPVGDNPPPTTQAPTTRPNPTPTTRAPTPDPRPDPEPTPSCQCSEKPVEGDYGCSCLWYQYKVDWQSEAFEKWWQCFMNNRRNGSWQWEPQWNEAQYEEWCRRNDVTTTTTTTTTLIENCDTYWHNGDMCNWIKCKYPTYTFIHRFYC
jgi:hypothetical protein